jgi:hypothetical protein
LLSITRVKLTVELSVKIIETDYFNQE